MRVSLLPIRLLLASKDLAGDVDLVEVGEWSNLDLTTMDGLVGKRDFRCCLRAMFPPLNAWWPPLKREPFSSVMEDSIFKVKREGERDLAVVLTIYFN